MIKKDTGRTLHVTKKGVHMLYVKMNKALYGLLKSAVGFYLRLRGKLEGKGYKINPYDPSVLKKGVNVEDLPKRSNVTWAIVREAHKRPTYNKAHIRGHAHQRTYAEVATPTNE